MTNCDRVQDQFKDWIFGELAAPDAAEVERHVSECAQCARMVEPYLGLHRAVTQSLSEQQLPAHLVFLPGHPRRAQSSYGVSLWRTAALAATAAVVFLVVLVGGYLGAGRLSHRFAAQATAATASETRALVRQEVQEAVAQQKREADAENLKLAANFHEEAQRRFALLNQRLDYLEATQRVVWRDSQERNAFLEVIARNSMLGQRQAAKP
jgi:anti-sigma factor RsiW